MNDLELENTEVEVNIQVNEPQIKQVSQKDAVFLALNTGIRETNKSIDGTSVLRSYVDKAVKKVARLELNNMIRLKLVKCKATYNDSQLKKYCSGLISNWMIKDKRYDEVLKLGFKQNEVVEFELKAENE